MTEHFVVWRGFRHEWLRTAVGFRTPHRISKLISHVDREHFTMGQNTGVDGNFMKPVGRLTVARSNQVNVSDGVVSFVWTDTADDGPYPRADSTLSKRVAIPRPEDTDISTAVLRGFALNTRCDPEKQGQTSCNSNGMWPHEFGISIGDVELDDTSMSFLVTVKIGRSWTPNRGGVPHIEEKPFNSRLDFELDIHYSVLSGRSDDLAVTALPGVTTRARARRREATSRRRTIEGVPNMAVGFSALKGFEFCFERTGKAAKTQHLGRYLGTLDFGVEDIAYNAPYLELMTRAQTWVPVTVYDTHVNYRIEPVLIQLSDGSSTNHEVSGSICCPSEGAPFFTAWNKCGDDTHGEPRHVDRVDLALSDQKK